MQRIEDHFNKEAEKYDSFFIDELGLKEFYDEIELQLNKSSAKENILVLGCGSGLEIERIRFKSNVTAIDISENMIRKLEQKKLHDEVHLETICGSFLEIDFEKDNYDIVLSCYTMHHFSEEQKFELYSKIRASLKANGAFVNGDSMVKSREEELQRFERAKTIYEEQNLPFGSLHIDVHFCLEHELETLMNAGFKEVKIEREWQNTKLHRATKA